MPLRCCGVEQLEVEFDLEERIGRADTCRNRREGEDCFIELFNKRRYAKDTQATREERICQGSEWMRVGKGGPIEERGRESGGTAWVSRVGRSLLESGVALGRKGSRRHGGEDQIRKARGHQP